MYNILKSKCKFEHYDYLEPKAKSNSGSFPEPFKKLIPLFEDDCDSKLYVCQIHQNKLCINGASKEGDTNGFMLKFGPKYENRLIVVYIGFINRRMGKMTKLYHLLKQIQADNGLNEIFIESAGAEGMKAWCIKNGFVPYPSDEKSYIEPQ